MANIDIASPGANADALRAALSKQGAGAFAQSAVASPVTGTTSETTLATITIPAGLLGANGQVEIITLWSYTNSANNKTLRVRFGGAAFKAQTATTTLSLQDYVRIANRNSTSSQISLTNVTGGFGNSTGTNVTAAIDTTAAVDITITGQLSNTGETITLESYLVKVYPKT